MIQKERVLVTGAAGFVGSHLARRLVKMGYDVSIFKLPGSNIWRLQDFSSKLQMFDVDLQNLNQVASAINSIKPKLVFHLAAYGLNDKESDMNLLINTNILGTLNLLRSIDKNSLDLFVNTGTWWEFGSSEKKVNEEHPLNPFNEYAVTKMAANFFCSTFHKLYNLPIVTLRPFSLYGTYEPKNRLIPHVIISSLLQKEIPLSQGKQKRDYLLVDDLIDAYIATIDNNEAIGETFNIGTGKDYTIREIVTKIMKLIGNPVEPQFGAIPERKNEIWRLRADISKANRMLKWKPKHTLDIGLKTTINWFRENLEKYTVD